MKLVTVLILGATLASSAFAAGSKYDAKKIYSALKVAEVPVNGGIGASAVQKSVGGLVCVKSKAVVPNAKVKYSCSVAQDPEVIDAATIYTSLSVKEVAMPSSVGTGKFQKSVGGLVCEKSSAVVPNAVPEYSCAILQ